MEINPVRRVDEAYVPDFDGHAEAHTIWLEGAQERARTMKWDDRF